MKGNILLLNISGSSTNDLFIAQPWRRRMDSLISQQKKTNKTINKNNLDINLNSQLTVQQHVNRVTSDVLSRFDGLLVHI